MDSRPSMSYLEFEQRPSDSYLELEERQSKSHLEPEPKQSKSYVDEEQLSPPADSYLESKSKPSDDFMGHDSRLSSEYLDLHDEVGTPRAQPTQRGIASFSEPNNGEVPSTHLYDHYYDDTALTSQCKSACENNIEAQNENFLQPPSCSTLPASNHLSFSGTGRQGQALPAPPPEASSRKPESFNIKYNTFSRKTHFQGNTMDHEAAIRQLSKDGGRFSKSSSRCCCIRCRDVIWLILGLLMTAACIAGCYYSTHTVVSRLCNQRNELNLGKVSTVLYGEVEFRSQNTTAFEHQFKSEVENAMRHSVLSFFLKNITVLGFTRGASDTGVMICRFSLTLRVEESKRKGLEDFVRFLLGEKRRPDGPTLRCIVIPNLYEATTYSCLETATSSSVAVTSSSVAVTSSTITMMTSSSVPPPM